MPRTVIPLSISDLSPFAKSLRQALSTHDGLPSHVELLNMLARAAGFQNFQHLRADAAAADKLVPAADTGPPADPAAPADHAQVAKAARYFDPSGKMISWPSRFAHQLLCLWVLWSRVPADTIYTERQFGDLIDQWHAFGDRAIIRRTMFEAGMIHRTPDGRQYRRIEQKPPAELSPLLARLASRAA